MNTEINEMVKKKLVNKEDLKKIERKKIVMAIMLGSANVYLGSIN